ncbi:hypothetical protein MO327_00210 [Xanthomonas translucens]|uniref:hypothetical protein n=1 Tax=Xanthomonas campestris pv. translucens TaxID=343 RepID=UPI00272999A8|nr:hypothetical protein [Xanthomonas translucens]WLA12401.1 hypothetical protein MO327_00210 [Xanthomonas translucens]
MSLTTDEIAPYIGIHFMEQGGETGLSLYRIAGRLKKRVNLHFSHVEWLGADYDSSGVSVFLTFFFSEKHLPTWLKESVEKDEEVRNLENHYFTVARVSGGRYAFHFSDADVRDQLLSECELIDLNSVSRARINALVLTGESELKAIWMHGIHRKNISKPDTKFITGGNLKAAIDPLSDQSYAYNATRVNVDLGGNQVSLGVNLANSFFWMRKVPSWDQFSSLTDVLGREIEGIKRLVESPLQTLSHPVKDFSGVSSPYEVQFLDMDAIPVGSLADSVRKMISMAANNFIFDIKAHPASSVGWTLAVTHIDTGNHPFYIGEINVIPAINKNGKISFDLKVVAQKNRKAQLDEFARLLSKPDLWVVRYESGHVITGGQCFQQSYKDVDFNDFVWSDFKGYDISKEKPLGLSGAADLSLIGADDSLFSWVINAILRKKRKNYFLSLEKPEDWLICDDGAGEIADFIHFGMEDGRTSITFIHVKAAKSESQNRKVSCSAYEVVLGQAIKNIRSVDFEKLKAEILKRISPSKKIWNVNCPAPKNTFPLFLSGIKGHVTMRVLVIQPHTRRSHYRSSVYKKQRIQLNTLLVNAKQVVTGLGAKFIVVGERH